MLKGIDRVLTAEMLHVLMSMGHGDDLLVCDVNHPAATLAAQTTHGSVVDMAGCDLERAITAVLTLMPLDTFVPEPVQRMTVVGDEGRLMPVHKRIQGVVDRAEGRRIGVGTLDRFAFYEAGRRAFAVVRTSDPGPYGCFLLRKGTV